MLSIEDTQALKDYVAADFKDAAGTIAFRSFEPPTLPLQNLSILQSYANKVEADCKTQFHSNDLLREVVLDTLFHDRSENNIIARSQFMKIALLPGSHVMPIVAVDEHENLIGANAYYITQWSSRATLQEKILDATSVPDTPKNHRIADYQSSAFSVAGAIIYLQGIPRPQKYMACDIFSVSATIAKFGDEALPLCQAYAEGRRMMGLDNMNYETASGLQAYLRDYKDARLSAGHAMKAALTIAG